MMEITRRTALGLMGAVAVPSAVTVGIAAAPPAVGKAMTAKERYEFHLAELKKAAEEMDPRIGSWSVVVGEDDEFNSPLAITAYRVTGKYAGDGLYLTGSPSALGRYATLRVRLLTDRVDGHRMFDVHDGMSRMHLAEPRFKTFVGKKIGGAI